MTRSEMEVTRERKKCGLRKKLVISRNLFLFISSLFNEERHPFDDRNGNKKVNGKEGFNEKLRI